MNLIDHTLSWEIARVGGILAYLLATASVLIGMLVSLKLRSTNWPRFVTTELHRYVTVLALVFTVVHGLAVWIDPFTGFTPSEVLVPFTSHYRPLWIGMGIVSGYLLLAVWASEYVRRWIGYAWWRRFHFLAFAVFVLGALHGIGAGTDTGQPWALALYGSTILAVLVLLGWRLLSGGDSVARGVTLVATGVGVLALAVFTLVGPAQPGWNAIANAGNGNGASAAWLAAHPDSPVAPATSFDADLTASLSQQRLSGTFDGTTPGSVELRADGGGAVLSLVLDDGWSCTGPATGAEGRIIGECQGSDASSVEVILSSLRRADGDVVTGAIQVRPTG
jgi:DMSO/TMAO reductase YedYZ heme-binding membrane subunit